MFVEYYPAGALTGEVVMDEDSVEVTTFKDVAGRVVLERRGDGDDTYYVYKSNGLLRYILSPMYQESTSTNYRYRYDYDDKGRLTKKTLPGGQYVYYWYDSDNRLILERDSRLTSKSKNRFFLYDRLGRLAVQGTCTQVNSNCSSPVYVSRNAATGTEVCGTGYYVTSIFTLSNPQIEIVNYYDDYSFLNATLWNSQTVSVLFNRPNPSRATSLQTGSITATSNGKYLLAVSYYDAEGRVIDTRENLLETGGLTTTTSYSFTGKPLTKQTTLTSGLQFFNISESFTYNSNDQLRYHDLTYGGDSTVRVASYSYNQLGRLSTLQQHNNRIGTLYTYDLHGWTKSIDVTKTYGQYSTLFRQDLYYADGSGTPCYNGNISSMKWKLETAGHGYKFSYDKRNRLTDASHTLYNMSILPYCYSETMTYNRNSAITSLIRTGNSQAGYGNMDFLQYAYVGNKLKSIYDMSSSNVYDGAFEFVDGANNTQEYWYNTAGDLTRDANKGIALINYDLLGHPIRVQFTNGNVTEYVYAADGRKLRAKQTTAIEGLTVPMGQTLDLAPAQTMHVDTTDYDGPWMFRKRGVSNVTYVDAISYHFDNGYITFLATLVPQPLSVPAIGYIPQFHYYVRDHLGCNRMVVGSDGTVEQTNQYYPYGGPWGDVSTNQGYQPFKYTGKELDRVHGLDWYDYGARRYDPAFCQFTQMDPLCEQYPHLSPYAYCAGNPVNAIDPDGKLIIFINGFHKGDEGATARYWNGFDTAVMNHFTDYNSLYRDGSLGGVINNLLNITSTSYSNLNPFIRGLKGFIQGALDAEKIFKNLSREENGEINESIRLVSHSMGGAYAKGYAQALVNYIAKHPQSTSGASITEYDFAPFQSSLQLAVSGVDTYQYSHLLDIVAKYTPVWGANMMPTETSWQKGHSINSFFKYISTLPEGRYKYVNGELIKE